LPDVAQGLELSDRLRELGGSRFEFREQAVPLAQGFDEVFYPGEIEDNNDAQFRREGVALPELKTLTRLGKRFRGSRNTRIFCLPTCYSRKSAKAQYTVYFASAHEARQAGYRPCKLCRPA